MKIRIKKATLTAQQLLATHIWNRIFKSPKRVWSSDYTLNSNVQAHNEAQFPTFVQSLSLKKKKKITILRIEYDSM